MNSRLGLSTAFCLNMLVLGGCTDVTVNPAPEAVSRERQRYQYLGSVLGEGGLSFGAGKTNENKRVNPHLWQASVESLSFMGLENLEPESGIVVTKWYTEPQTPNERVKVVSTVMSSRLSSNALRISVITERKNAKGVWLPLSTRTTFERALEEKILLRARALNQTNSTPQN